VAFVRHAPPTRIDYLQPTCIRLALIGEANRPAGRERTRAARYGLAISTHWDLLVRQARRCMNRVANERLIVVLAVRLANRRRTCWPRASTIAFVETAL
jgi:hypothetical protein